MAKLRIVVENVGERNEVKNESREKCYIPVGSVK